MISTLTLPLTLTLHFRFTKIQTPTEALALTGSWIRLSALSPHLYAEFAAGILDLLCQPASVRPAYLKMPAGMPIMVWPAFQAQTAW